MLAGLLHTYVLENHKGDVYDILLQPDSTEHFAMVIKLVTFFCVVFISLQQFIEIAFVPVTSGNLSAETVVCFYDTAMNDGMLF